MKEILDTRTLGALRWIDAVTHAPIPGPLAVTGTGLRFTRTFDLASLPAGDVVPNGDITCTKPCLTT